MTSSHQMLSVVLTVHNAEKTLAAHVARMLDVLPELASRFELLIVDDGSTDQTEEVAHELARDYPQLRVARHPRRLGSDAAAKTALEHTTGDIVILHDPVADTGTETRVVGAIRRDPPLREPVRRCGPLELLQDPALDRSCNPPHPAAPSPKLPLRGVRISPRRIEALAPLPTRSVSQPHGPETAAPTLPRVLARLSANRPSVASPDGID